MLEEPGELLQSFMDAIALEGLIGIGSDIIHEVLRAPHRQPSSYPFGFCATYVYSLSAAYGQTCAAGANRVLKVGKVGPNSGPRFISQHYSPNSTRSNLAKSILNERVLWPYLGIERLEEMTVKAWMLTNLERDHFFVPVVHAGAERELERYIRGRVGPVFEG